MDTQTVTDAYGSVLERCTDVPLIYSNSFTSYSKRDLLSQSPKDSGKVLCTVLSDRKQELTESAGMFEEFAAEIKDNSPYVRNSRKRIKEKDRAGPTYISLSDQFLDPECEQMFGKLIPRKYFTPNFPSGHTMEFLNGSLIRNMDLVTSLMTLVFNGRAGISPTQMFDKMIKSDKSSNFSHVSMQYGSKRSIAEYGSGDWIDEEFVRKVLTSGDVYRIILPDGAEFTKIFPVLKRIVTSSLMYTELNDPGTYYRRLCKYISRIIGGVRNWEIDVEKFMETKDAY